MNGAANREETGREPDVSDTGNHEREISSSHTVVGQFERIVAGGVMQSSPDHHPIFDKFNSDHVTQFLEHSHEIAIEEKRHRRENTRLFFGGSVISIVGFGLLTWYLLPNHSDMFFEILKTIGASALGAAGGYGFKAYQDQRRS